MSNRDDRKNLKEIPTIFKSFLLIFFLLDSDLFGTTYEIFISKWTTYHIPNVSQKASRQYHCQNKLEKCFGWKWRWWNDARRWTFDAPCISNREVLLCEGSNCCESRHCVAINTFLDSHQLFKQVRDELLRHEFSHFISLKGLSFCLQIFSLEYNYRSKRNHLDVFLNDKDSIKILRKITCTEKFLPTLL